MDHINGEGRRPGRISKMIWIADHQLFKIDNIGILSTLSPIVSIRRSVRIAPRKRIVALRDEPRPTEMIFYKARRRMSDLRR